MEISWQPQPHDLVDAVAAHRHHRQPSRLVLLLVPTLAVALATLAGLATDSYLVAALWGVGWLILLYRVFLIQNSQREDAKSARKFATLYHRYPQLRQPVSARIDGNGISSWTAGSAISVPWNKICQVLETPSSFVIITRFRGGLNLLAKVMGLFGKKAATAIPKRALAGPAEVAALRDLLQNGTRRAVIPVAGITTAPELPAGQ